MSTTSTNQNDPPSRRIRPPREVDYDSAPVFEQRLQELIEHAEGDVVVDFGEVTFIDSSGLAALVRAHRNAALRGRRLLLIGVGESTRRVLGITGLDGVLHVLTHRAE